MLKFIYAFFFRFAGIQEIVLAYQNCIRQVQLYGPTNVAPIINHVIRFAERAGQENTASVRNRYHIGHDRYFVVAQQYTDGCWIPNSAMGFCAFLSFVLC